jgi:hypothetical protein
MYIHTHLIIYNGLSFLHPAYWGLGGERKGCVVGGNKEGYTVVIRRTNSGGFNSQLVRFVQNRNEYRVVSKPQ